MHNSATTVGRRRFLTRSAQLLLGGIAAGTGSLAYAYHAEVEWLSVERVELPLAGLPAAAAGITIAQLSDLHLYPFTTAAFIEQVISATARLNPDLVVLTGDYVLTRADAIFELAPLLARLNPRYGIYACIGNHDIWTDRAVVRQGLREAGIDVLENQGLAIGGSRDLFYLAGLDDGWSGQPDLPAALARRPVELPVVLLFHEPDFADIIAADGRVAVQLAGHTHGGQVRVPLYGPPILPPYGEKYDQGLRKVGKLWLYTNRGIGVIDPPVRVNCRPELTLFTLSEA